MKLNLPCKITVARIMIIPIVVVLYCVNFKYHEIAAAVMFCLCCCTDFIDGNIARKRNMVTDLGKFLDPIADKVIVVVMLFMLTAHGELSTWYNALIAGVVMSRELIITAFRTIAVQKKVVLAADVWGKIKTICLDVALGGLILAPIQTGRINGEPLYFFWWAGIIIFYIGSFFAIYSGINYVVKNKKVLEDAPKVEKEMSIAQEEKSKLIEVDVKND